MDQIYHRNENIMEADIGDELVALDVQDGSCFGFNAVATDVWKFLATPRSRTELQAELTSRYDVDAGQCASELESLLDQMARMGLVSATRQAA